MNITKIQTQLTKLNTIFTQFNDICDGPAIEIFNSKCSYSADRISTHLFDMKNKEKSLKVGIIGRVKAGKSSLINALFFDGREVLPKAATPMTAALTTIGYSDKFTAQVDFFSADDLDKLRQKAQQYQCELEKAVQNEDLAQRKRLKERLKPGQAEQQIDITRVRSIAKRRIDEQHPTLKAAADLHDRIKSSNVQFSSLPEFKVLEANSEEELNQELYNYVGSKGKYMPFTRSLHIGLPTESLKDILVIDTPGLNDVVTSREQRTYEMLIECNVVFIVSPAGQFLHAQDLELANRLTKREGIQEIFVIASQIDTQLYGSEKDKYLGKLPDVIHGVKELLAQQSSKTLAEQDNEVLKNIAHEQQNRLFVTSSICHTLLQQVESKWDSVAAHTMGMLKHNYAEYFSDIKQKEQYLEMLSGKTLLLNAIKSVRYQKESIIEKQIHNFITAQETSVQEVVDELINHFKQLEHDIESSDLSSMQKKFNELMAIRQKGVSVSNSFFLDEVDELKLDLTSNLKTLVKEFRHEIKDDINSAEGSVTETYKMEKSGILSWFYRKVDIGGYEDVNETLTTINARIVKDALEDMQDFIQNGLNDCTKDYLLQWRKKLSTGLLNKLRNTLGDDLIDPDRLASICRTVISKMQDLPQPDIPTLPSELVKTNKLKGEDAEEYINNTSEYLSLLLTEANNYIRVIGQESQKMSEYDIGLLLFDNLQKEMEQLKNMVENKRTTIDRLHKIIQNLKEIV